MLIRTTTMYPTATDRRPSAPGSALSRFVRSITPAAAHRRLPALPTRPSMRDRFPSASLGTYITTNDLQFLDYDQARVLAGEVADELRLVKAEIEQGRLPGHSHSPGRDRLAHLHRRRPFLQRLHQAVLARKAETRPTAPAASDTPSALPDVAPESAFFVQAARNSLDAATFQRLTLIAAQRRAAELSRLSGMAIDPDHVAA